MATGSNLLAYNFPTLFSWRALYQGGLGAVLACTTGSSRVAIPGASSGVDQIGLINIGDQTAFVRLGGDDITATVACLPIPVLYPIYLPLVRFPDAPALATYIAGITSTGTATVIVTAGQATRNN